MNKIKLRILTFLVYQDVDYPFYDNTSTFLWNIW